MITQTVQELSRWQTNKQTNKPVLCYRCAGN